MSTIYTPAATSRIEMEVVSGVVTYAYIGTDFKIYKRVRTGAFSEFVTLTGHTGTNYGGSANNKIKIADTGWICAVYIHRNASLEYAAQVNVFRADGSLYLSTEVSAANSIAPVKYLINIGYYNDIFHIGWTDAYTSMGKDFATTEYVPVSTTSGLGTQVRVHDVEGTGSDFEWFNGTWNDDCAYVTLQTTDNVDEHFNVPAFVSQGFLAGGYGISQALPERMSEVTSGVADGRYLLKEISNTLYIRGFSKALLDYTNLATITGFNSTDNQLKGYMLHTDVAETTMYIYVLVRDQPAVGHEKRIYSIPLNIAHNVVRAVTLEETEVIATDWINPWLHAYAPNLTAYDHPIDMYWYDGGDVYEEWVPVIGPTGNGATISLTLPAISLAMTLYTTPPANQVLIGLTLPAISLEVRNVIFDILYRSPVQLQHSLFASTYELASINYFAQLGVDYLPMVKCSIDRRYEYETVNGIEVKIAVETVIITTLKTHIALLNEWKDKSLVITRVVDGISQVLSTTEITEIKIGASFIDVYARAVISEGTANQYQLPAKMQNIRSNDNKKNVRLGLAVNVLVGDLVELYDGSTILVGNATTSIGFKESFTELESI